CGKAIVTKEKTGYEGRITSPYYPSYYPPKCLCAWNLQTPHKNLGIALKFHNYTISEKNIKGCERGWWKINEHMLADPRAWRAYLGMRIQGSAKFVSAVRRIIVHEYYNSRNYDYDIALLQLSKPWPDTMSHVIQPICVPPLSHKVRSGDKCWITGWGQKQEADDKGAAILQKAEVEIIDQTLCHSTYGIITARMFCAGLMSGRRDGCKYLILEYAYGSNKHHLLKLGKGGSEDEVDLEIVLYSEGEYGLRAYYWNTFWAPQDVIDSLKKLIPLEQKETSSKQIPHVFSTSGKGDFDLVTMELFVSFDLYAKPGNNRTLTLMNPKKSFYQWRLRVPSNCVVRLVVTSLHVVPSESCASHRLSAYDFLLPLQNKIITRYVSTGQRGLESPGHLFGLSYCKDISENGRNREFGYSVAINFHSDELLTHRGFYIEYRAFSHTDPCGRQQFRLNRIVGGEDAQSGKWPWQASLQIGAHGHVCGASVISKRWLVSAAHCFLDSDSVRYSAPSRWRAYMGLRAVNEKSNHVAMRSIKRIIIHPQYDQSISDYDIALLEMETQVFFSELVQPICLPSSSRVFLYGTVCYVTGWGAMKENSMFIFWIHFLQVWLNFKHLQ
ncbi:UNVERIFIED_CONTAM: hypothetical protein H355_004793, partial [Colinus virginianus]